MSAVALDRQYRIERIANRIATTLQKQYPFITTEIVLDPPDGETDAWVVVHGARDADQNDEITESTLDLTIEGMEQEGVLVLAM
jgi:hypothetical protein